MAEESNLLDIHSMPAEALLTDKKFGAVAPPSALLDEERISRKKVLRDEYEEPVEEHVVEPEEVPDDPRKARLLALKKRLVRWHVACVLLSGEDKDYESESCRA